MSRAAAVLLPMVAPAFLAACAQVGDLRPAEGGELPVAPVGREDRPSPGELLDPAPQAVPERSVELRRRSEERADDPFDLPPEG